MAKDFVINTSRVNSYGTRVITKGVYAIQYIKNLILLYMHQRGWSDTTLVRTRYATWLAAFVPQINID